MISESENCPVCGLPQSGLLEKNCPACLMRLGTPALQGEGPALESVAPMEVNELTSRRFGDYELLEEVARGGMGVVFRARQVSLNRTVAVKVLLGGGFANETFTKRFRREAEAAGGLNHPNIVSIHEVGEHEGQPYFSMELIEGRNLSELVRNQPLPARQAAQLLQTIAGAVHFAHERGVLHRDLKPSNVLVDALDVPHITDFGLAKHVDGDADLTVTGQVLGTPNYMPPEQADPRRGPTTAASDVYSLGAILYHLLTGRPPFMAESLTQTLRLVAEGEPVSPRLLIPGVPRDLETICIKCLQKDLPRRYASAQELAGELGRFLRDEPIRARPIGTPARLLRWCRRKPALAGSIGAAAALLLIVAIGSPIALIRIRGERELARAAELETERQLYTALLEQARATAKSGELGQRVRAMEAVRRAGAISNSAALRGAAISALALPDLRFEREVPIPTDLTMVQLDPAFERIALCRGNGPVEIRTVSDQRLLATLPTSTNRAAYVGQWSPDGRFLAIKRDHDTRTWRVWVEVWDVAAARRILLLKDVTRSAISFHPWMPRLIVGVAPSNTAIHDLETGLEVARHQLGGEGELVQFSPDGEHYAALHAAEQRSMVTVHRTRDGAPQMSHVFSETTPNVAADFAWHPTGSWIAVSDLTGVVHRMDVRTGEASVLGRHKAAAVRTVFSPDGRYLFTGGWERELICWDVKTMLRAFTIGLDSHYLQYRADGRRCAIIRTPETRVQLHAFERSTLYREFAEDLGGGRSDAAFSPDGRWLAACGAERLVVWDLASDRPGAVIDEPAIRRVAFAANGELFASRIGAGFRWHVAPGIDFEAPPKLERLPLANTNGLVSLCLAADGLAFTGAGGSTLAGFGQLASDSGAWKPTVGGLNGASPDGRWLGMFRSWGTHLYVHRLPDLESVAKLPNEEPIGQFEFSPASDEVAVVSGRGVTFWSTSTWQRTRQLANFTSILYSTDARTFWLSMGFRSAGLYDARTAEELLPLPSGTLPLALSPDGRHLAVSVDARRVQLWDLAEVRNQLRGLGLDWANEQAPMKPGK